MHPISILIGLGWPVLWKEPYSVGHRPGMDTYGDRPDGTGNDYLHAGIAGLDLVLDTAPGNTCTEWPKDYK